MTKMFIDEVHAQNVLQRMWEQTERKEYCDVALIAGDTEETQISAHRSVLSASSEYFKTMFTPPFNESTAKEVRLPDVDGESLKSLVKFCYSGRLEMTEDTVEKLLITADSLLLDAVVNGCGDFLAEQLDSTNCLGMAQLAERHHCDTLIKKARDYCMKYFVELYKNDEFLNLSVKQLTQLLSSDNLNDPTEEHVFKSLMVWLEHDSTEREQYKDEMLKLVRFPLLNPTFLIDHVQPVCTSPESHKYLMKAVKWHLIPERRIVHTSIFSKPRRPNELLMAIKRENNKLVILYHCPQRFKWMKWLANFDSRSDFRVAVMGDDLFIVGGLLENATLNTVICLNIKTLMVKCVNPMSEPRYNVGVAVLKGFLYAVGGRNVNNRINSVEKWDTISNTWNKVAPMSIGRSAFGITVFNEKLYVVGGVTTAEDSAVSSAECYLPEENLWAPIASMCEKRLNPRLTVSNGILYAMGGTGSRTIESYDHVTNKWTPMCSLSEAISGRLCTTFNNKVIALYKDHVEEYDTTTNEFKVNTSIAGLEDVCYTFSFSGLLLESKFIEN